MSPDPIRVLLFEDTRDDARKFLDRLRERATDKLFEVVWFIDGFLPPPSLDQPFPVTMSSRQRPTVHLVSRDGEREELGKAEWWPSEFDAAVLDVMHESARPVGRWYASWLRDSDFTGLVQMVSKQELETNVPRTQRFSEDRKGEQWDERAADAVAGVLPGAARVNQKGRPPERLLADFYASVPGHVAQWDFAFFGADRSLSALLGTFFQMKPFDGKPILDPAAMTGMLREADKRGRRKPHVVFIECGTGSIRLDDDLLSEAEEVLDAVTYCPIFAFLADGNAVSDPQVLRRVNSTVVSRAVFIRSPSDWARSAIDRLCDTYQDFYRTYKRQGLKQAYMLSDTGRWNSATIAAGEAVLDAVLGPLIMARSIDRLANVPHSLPLWLNPRTGDRLNNTFESVPRAVIRALKEHGFASKSQLALFSTPRAKPKPGGEPASL